MNNLLKIAVKDLYRLVYIYTAESQNLLYKIIFHLIIKIKNHIPHA